MNVLITLPKHLIDAILSGKKQFEMRLSKPAQMDLKKDGFFCVEKGTDNVRCWCRCDAIVAMDSNKVLPRLWSKYLAVNKEYIAKYCAHGRKVYFWHIEEVVQFEEESLCRDSLFVDHNPQQFAYCPLSYGRSY